MNSSLASFLIYISSDDKTPDSVSTSDFTVSFGNNNKLNRVRSYVIKSVSIPNVSYNLYPASPSDNVPANNIFTYSSGSITVTPGHYSMAQLITAITSDSIAVSDSLAITLDPITGKLTFTTASPVSYFNLADGNSMGYILGIGTSGGPTLSFTADNLPDLSGINNVFISSSALSGQSTQIIQQKVNRMYIIDLPINSVPYGFYFNYETTHELVDTINSATTYFNLNNIDIKLYDPLGRIIDLHGLVFNMTIRAYYDS